VEKSTTRNNGWVCDEDVRLEGPKGRGWSVGRVSFLAKGSYERVLLHLERAGPDIGAPPSVTAEAFATSRIRDYVARAARPGSGRTTVGIHLANGIKGTLGLRGYRPRGMQTLREFSAYPAAGGSTKMLITVAGDGCFRLRAPAWNDDAANSQTGQIYLDIRP
jgi:hypothetical protein